MDADRDRDWFRQLTGFDELTWEDTRRRLRIEGQHLLCPDNGRRYNVGSFEMPSLAELRLKAEALSPRAGRLRLSLVQGDVRELHEDPGHAGSVFQVASQFNMLEMVSPDVSPEHGVTRYQWDRTQGPACAIAAGAATIFRNYFVEVDGEQGQTQQRQLDGLRDLGTALGELTGLTPAQLWQMRNGYAQCTAAGLAAMAAALDRAEEHAPIGKRDHLREHLRERLRVGVHRNVEVTSGVTRKRHMRPAETDHEPGPLVTQVFCSALPVAYGRHPSKLWAPFARLVLEAAYEATLLEAALSRSRGDSGVVFLTLLGGGAFGNDEDWIVDGLRHALQLCSDFDLDARLVSYDGRVTTQVRGLLKDFG